jgi:SAM-dependent methyltransferase
MPPACQLYADLSAYYDRCCQDINYPEQALFLQRVHAAFVASGGRNYLDVACGTGQLLAQMGAAGYSLHGLDYSPAMLAQAAKRCPSAQLLQADMANWQPAQGYDLISCLLYSLHYNPDLPSLQAFFAAAYQALLPGGVLVLDTVDKNGIANHLGTTHRWQEAAQTLTFSSRWYYPGEGDYQELQLQITQETDGQRHLWQDRHPMVALAATQTQALLQAAGFDVLPLERNFACLEAWQGHSSNLLVLACKTP